MTLRILTATALAIASVVAAALLSTPTPQWLGTAALIVGSVYAMVSALVIVAHDERLTKWLGERGG